MGFDSAPDEAHPSSSLAVYGRQRLRDTSCAPAQAEGKRKMASKVPGTLSIIELCRWELERVHQLAAEYRNVVHESSAWLAARKLESGLLASDGRQAFVITVSDRVQICRDRAEENRVFAERAEDPQAKHLLLEIAATYDRLPDVLSWDDA